MHCCCTKEWLKEVIRWRLLLRLRKEVHDTQAQTKAIISQMNAFMADLGYPDLRRFKEEMTAQQARRDSVPYAALYIAPILIDTRLHSTRGQFFIRHECGAMYTSQNEHFAYTYDIAVCIRIQYIRHHLSAYFR